MKQRTKEVLNKVDNYLMLMRFKYTDLEKLSRLNVLNDYYNTLNTKANIEKLHCKIECAEELKDGTLILPLKVKGIFLTEGRPKEKFYTSEELEKSTNNVVNQKFPLMLDHRDDEASAVIGMVTKIVYDPYIKGIRWWGHINDETFARNVLDGAIKEVSATIYSRSEYDEKLGLVGKDLTYKELSLIFKGAEPFNSIIAYDYGEYKID